MTNWVRIFIAGCFYYGGLVKLARWWTQRSSGGWSRRDNPLRSSSPYLVILNYHRAAEGDFRRHLLYLRRHYRILHLETTLEELYGRHKTVGAKRPQGIYHSEAPTRLPADRRPLLSITFDDGYYDNYACVFPLVRELQIPATIFLVPSYIENGNCFWWLAGEFLVSHAQVKEITLEEHVYHLDQEEGKNALIQAIYNRARYATSIAEREAFLTATRQALAATDEFTDKERLALPMEWPEVLEMDRSEWISFGAHTMNHPVLAYLTDPTELLFEIQACRATLEHTLGHPVRSFAYPIGKTEHIGDNVCHAVQNAGYDWAVTTVNGINTAQTNPYLLRRVEVEVSHHWLVMAAQVAGVWGFFARCRRLPAMLVGKFSSSGKS